MVQGIGHRLGRTGQGMEDDQVLGGADGKGVAPEGIFQPFRGEDLAVFRREGIFVPSVLIGDFDQHHFLDVPGHRGLGHIEPCFFQRLCQITLGFDLLVFDDFFDGFLSGYFHDFRTSYRMVCPSFFSILSCHVA